MFKNMYFLFAVIAVISFLGCDVLVQLYSTILSVDVY
jgi:hypothetical protein